MVNDNGGGKAEMYVLDREIKTYLKDKVLVSFQTLLQSGRTPSSPPSARP